MSTSKEIVIIRGARPAKGEFTPEGGSPTPYDYTELYIDQALDPEIASGSATVPVKFGDSLNYHTFLKGKQFPFKAEIDVLTVTNGRGSSRRVVLAVRPFEPNKG